jgi:hypothetical protein
MQPPQNADRNSPEHNPLYALLLLETRQVVRRLVERLETLYRLFPDEPLRRAIDPLRESQDDKQYAP